MRALRAFLLAPLCMLAIYVGVALINAALQGRWDWIGSIAFSSIYIFVIGAAVAYALTLVFALPAFLILNRNGWVNPYTAIGIAALIGSLLLPAIEFERVMTIRAGSLHSAGSGECRTIDQNVRTACGYRALAADSAFFAFLGGVAGLAWWLIYSRKSDGGSE